MHPLPAEQLASYRRCLNQSGIGAAQQAHYLKWLRYYWDFCIKNGRSPLEPVHLQPFLEKLKQKGQSSSLRVQAREAIHLFYSVAVSSADSSEKERLTDRHAATITMASSKRKDWQQSLTTLSDSIKMRHYSPKTRSSYVNWVERFAAFHHDKAPLEMSAETARAFLTDLAVRKRVAASTQNQAFNALLYFYRHVLKADYELGDTVVRAKSSKYIPTVLNRNELDAILGSLRVPFDLIVSMLYGCGLRLSECLNLRINCLNFDQDLVIVHDGKGQKDRSVPIPKKLRAQLEAQVSKVNNLLNKDLAVSDFGGVFMPPSIHSKSAGKELQWQWVFPAKTLTLVPDEGCYRRYHNHERHVGAAIRMAARKAKVPKRVTAHTFRHTSASHLLAANVDIRTIQQLLGHSDVRTTMIYTHTVQSQTKKEMLSPLDLE